jgi:hypothetical protein
MTQQIIIPLALRYTIAKTIIKFLSFTTFTHTLDLTLQQTITLSLTLPIQKQRDNGPDPYPNTPHSAISNTKRTLPNSKK